jgi:hypothetical protein
VAFLAMHGVHWHTYTCSLPKRDYSELRRDELSSNSSSRNLTASAAAARADGWLTADGVPATAGLFGAWLMATRRSGYYLGVARARQPRRPEASFGLAAGGDESGWRLPHRVASHVQ